MRVKEPDRDETLLEFDSEKEIEMRAGDWITGSYSNGRLKYLLNHKIRQYWDVQVQQGKGCVVVVLVFVVFIAAVATLLASDVLTLF